MTSFSYKAISSQGKTVMGEIAADRIELASRELKSQGLTLISLVPAGEGSSVASLRSSGKGGLSSGDVLELTRELAVLLRAGLPIDRALKVMIDMAGQSKRKGLLESLLSSVKAGKGLSEALVPFPGDFNNFYVNMVRSGEASGRMSDALERLAGYLTNAKAVRSSVVSALIYPAILLAVAVISILGMLGFVVPQFQALFNDMGEALPLLTRAVISAGEVLKSYGWIIFLFSAAVVLFFRYWLRTPAGRTQFDQRVLSLPFVGDVVFKYEMSKFSKTAGTLMGTGVSLLQAISIAVDIVDNTVIKNALNVLAPAVKRGQKMSVALEEARVFSPLVIQMVRVGEESGSLDQMMTELAQVYDDEVQAGVKRGLILLEPALILIMGATIAVVIIAILMGIMSVNDLAV